MLKPVVPLSRGALGRTLIGGLVALLCYGLLQTVCAFLLHREIVDESALYPGVCICAAMSSFAGCGYSVLKGRGSRLLSASAVAAVFLALTVVVGIFTMGADMQAKNGMTGVGLSMAAGGLLAAAVGDALLARRSEKNRRKRRGGQASSMSRSKNKQK